MAAAHAAPACDGPKAGTPAAASLVLVACSVPTAGVGSEPPPALLLDGSRLAVDVLLETLEDAGVDSSPSRCSVGTNATFFKFFELWALGRGLAPAHVVNSGRTLGDNRVDWRTVSLAAQRVGGGAEEPRPVLIVGADLRPVGEAAARRVAALLTACASSGASGVLLQPPGAGGSCAPGSEGGSGGEASFVSVRVGGDAGSVVAVGGEGSSAAGSSEGAGAGLVAPPLLLLQSADAAFLDSAEGNAALQEAAAALLAASPASPPASPSAAAPLGSLSTGAPELAVPLEAAMRVLAARGRLAGVGAGEGAPLFTRCPVPALDSGAFPAGAGAVPPSPPSPYTVALPLHLLGAPLGPAVHARAFARVGVLGNPSDGFYGKTLSVTVANFAAEAWVHPLTAGRRDIVLLPHPLYDPLAFPCLPHLSSTAKREGYAGGIRLLTAALHRLHAHCASRGVALPPRGCVIRYHTTVPRQVGLAGSSAIVTALLRALLAFYGHGSEEAAAALGLSRDRLPAFVLAIESEELGITAGLQDRVVQAYGGAVHMDFGREGMEARGHGAYTRVPVSALPPLFLAYAADPSDSGRIHAPVKQRWLAGDRDVVEGMQGIAALADAGLALASSTPYGGAGSVAGREAVAAAWAALFSRNFAGRRRLFGDAALGRENLRMVAIAGELGAAAKFPGSGGAVVGVVDVRGMAAAGALPGLPPAAEADAAAAGPEAEEAAARARVAAATEVLRAAYHAEGFVFVRLEPREPVA